MIPYALKNGAASSDRIDVTANATIDNLSPWSAGGWFQMDSFANTLPRIFNKGASDQTRFLFNTGSGDLNCVQVRAGGSATSTTATGFYTLGIPQFIVATYADSDVIRIYVGSLTKPPAEPSSYVTQSNTGTTVQDNSGSPLTIMNRSTVSTANRALVGKGWSFAIVPVQLSLGQIIEWWRTGHPPVSDIRIDMPALAAGGTGTVLDVSRNRNHGTITGAIPVNAVLPRARR